ncbi:MAG: hypothetical protein V4864_13770 [Pseudomonadota bacterium]
MRHLLRFLFAAAAMLAAAPVCALTFTVNSPLDAGDSFLADGICDITGNPGTNPPIPYSNLCTLRAAIQQANFTPGNHTIALAQYITVQVMQPLPALTKPVTIRPEVGLGTVLTMLPEATIAWAGTGASGNALTLLGGNSVVEWISIVGFSGGSAIRLQGGGGSVVFGNFLGLHVNGTAAANRGGVEIADSADNTVGDTNSQRGNVISGNGGTGVYIQGAGSVRNTVIGNYIGADRTGAGAMGNQGVGVWVDGGSDNRIGGGTRGERNLIIANRDGGVILSNADRNRVTGNFIGTVPGGGANLGNGSVGVFIRDGRENVVGAPVRGVATCSAPTATGTGTGTTTTTTTTTTTSPTSGSTRTTSPNTATMVGRAANPNAGGPPGNVISANDGPGVSISGANARANRVEGNTIGMDETGLIALGNRSDGIAITDAQDNLVGSLTEGSGNLISANGRNGVRIRGALASGNRVQANWIGVDCTGKAAAGNLHIGVYVDGAPRSSIGGTVDALRNLISGNGPGGSYSGVHVSGATAQQNRVEGNTIGMDRNGLAPLGNSGNGVTLDEAPGNFVGGLNDFAQNLMPRNLVSGNGGSGVVIRGGAAQHNQVRGNYIGPDATGEPPVPGSLPFVYAQLAGVWINGAPNNHVGGMEEASRNLVSNNRQQGVLVSGAAASGNFVRSNRIGTDHSGQVALPNGESGVALLDAADNFIGGRTPTMGKAPGNLVSGNLGSLKVGAVHIAGATATGNQVRGNFIGMAADGTTPLPNGYDGVFIGGNASRNLIGGELRAHGNLIAHNRREGVAIDKGAGAGNSTGNAILSNRIFANKQLGIDLGFDGPSPPPPRLHAGVVALSGAGPNNWQRAAHVRLGGGVVGLLDAAPNTAYRVQYFSSAEGDVSGYGQGEALLDVGTKVLREVRTDAEGFAKFRFPSLPPGRLLSVTVTGPGNDTSEFSKLACIGAPADSAMSGTATWAIPNPVMGEAPNDLPPNTKVQMLDYPGTTSVTLRVQVDKGNKTGDDDLSRVFVRVVARNLARDAPVQGGEVSYLTRYQPLGTDGRADLVLYVGDMLKALAAPLNKNFIEASVEFCYRGRIARASTADVLHIVRDKVIVFLPGVMGSRIQVSSLGVDTWAYPVFHLNPIGGASLLKTDKQGVPERDATRLSLFRSYNLAPFGSIPGLDLATVYDLDTAMDAARLRVGLPRLLVGGSTTPFVYHHILPWPYDWRLKLRDHVQALVTGQATATPAFDDYASPPSVQQILDQWVPTLGAQARFVDGKVALAGHSTGGLVIRSALTGPHAAALQSRVGHAYFINTPFRGAPKAYYSYLTGKMIEAFIAADKLREMAPDMPIVYHLAPANGYTDRANQNLVATGLDPQGNPVNGRRTPPPVAARTYMDPLISRATNATSTWNIALADEADAFHTAMMARDPVIGWHNTITFWTTTAKKPDTPATVRVTSPTAITHSFTLGDGTVPSSSQYAGVPDRVQVRHRFRGQPEHQFAANNPTVWANIIRDLNVPRQASFAGYVPQRADPNGATAATCLGTGVAETWGMGEMDRIALGDGYKIMAASGAAGTFRQGFDEVYCDGIFVNELRATGGACHGTLVIGEAKGGYRGDPLEDVMSYGYAFRQGTIEWAGNAAAFSVLRGSARARAKARYYLRALAEGGRTRVETFHAECGPAPAGSPPPRTLFYLTDVYP